MKHLRRWLLPGLAGLLLALPAVAGASEAAGGDVESAGGMAAAIACGLFIGSLGPVAGIIAGLISSCGWLLFDAIFL
jgi:hypothetical protein